MTVCRRDRWQIVRLCIMFKKPPKTRHPSHNQSSETFKLVFPLKLDTKTQFSSLLRGANCSTFQYKKLKQTEVGIYFTIQFHYRKIQLQIFLLLLCSLSAQKNREACVFKQTLHTKHIFKLTTPSKTFVSLLLNEMFRISYHWYLGYEFRL